MLHPLITILPLYHVSTHFLRPLPTWHFDGRIEADTTTMIRDRVGIEPELLPSPSSKRSMA